MEELCVKDFINIVKVKREYEEDDCEYEVTRMAMEFYSKYYPCYKGWEPIMHGNSIGNYMRKPNQKHRKGYRGIKNYFGACLLKEKSEDRKMVLTADILTSITSPINSLLKIKLSKYSYDYYEENKRDKDIAGEDIIKTINQSCQDKRGSIVFDSLVGDEMCRLEGDIVSYVYAFAYVYHWCGNMMPVIWNPGVGTRDTIIYKVKKIKEFFENPQEDEVNLEKIEERLKTRKGRTYTVLWKMWIKFYWNKKTISDFMKSNYLIDVSSRKEDFFNNDIHINSQWFMTNTKLIVQRSYRILFGVQDAFTQEQTEFIKEVFQYIFSEAQIPEEQRDLELV